MQRLFLTEKGDPVSAVTAAEARQLLAVADRTKSPGIAEIIECSGRSAYSVACAERSSRELPVVILPERGTLSGAVGLSLARHLSNHGISVVVLEIPHQNSIALPGLASAAENQWRAFLETEGVVASSLAELPRRPRLIVEAMPAAGPAMLDDPDTARLCRWINEARRQESEVLSLDIPCGVDATTGVAAEGAVRPDRTLCLALPKTGLQEGSCGRIAVADAGIPARAYQKIAIVAYPCVFRDAFVLPLQGAF
ncbi:NAD(P)H-hydrate epimerase [Alkalispirochaeta americana]|uniref:NAD(P)H-hydrate epimerase n=1 Tax=Alkalispirochaeta americana TaxID=159291 RepID=A0A1N6QT86_9SPIO|nr:NAD(P)H-hydrate epimerase [Alkalispirochaeta americana]SIQ19722.1 NAD(P)H-hydrate epimerase [Alkalispirochaeta americana]